ncbi:MAG TPA: hypothetical protein VIW92_11835, partial [Thermoanaerobaculia bacterium]
SWYPFPKSGMGDMDRELITYLQQLEERLDQRFTRVEERFTETDGQLQSLRKEVVTFREETAQGFAEVGSEVRRVHEEMAQGLEEVKGDIRQAHVSVEDLRGEVRQVAEGVANANERLDRYKDEVSRNFKESEARHRNGYHNLEGRVRKLEEAR